MPKVKQADFDLNAILTELIGTDEDLHREVMGNLIEGQPYEFKVINKMPKTIYKAMNDWITLRVDAIGKGLKFEWGYGSPTTFRNFIGVGNNDKVIKKRMAWDQLDTLCKVTDKYGHVAYSNVCRLIKIVGPNQQT